MRAVNALRRRAAGEGGFTLLIVIGVLVVLSGLSLGAYAAVNGDIHPAAHTDEEKRAYAAAQAGLGYVAAQLALDPNYALTCPTPAWTPVDSADPTNKAAYYIEVVPVGAACQSGVESSIVDPATGTMRVEITGRGRPDVGTDRAPRRAIIATFRRATYTSYLSMVDVEDLDPDLEAVAWGVPGTGVTTPDLVNWAGGHCAGYWGDRQNELWRGTYNIGGSGLTNWSARCYEAQYAASDSVAGPFHSNDSIMVCGNPTFGAVLTDASDVSDSTTAAVRDASNDARYSGNQWGCSAALVDPRSATPPRPAMQVGRPIVQMPAWNAAAWSATPTKFTGKTTIVFNSNDTMTVTNAGLTPNPKTIAQPQDGVIYVAGNAGCYKPENPSLTATLAACGDVQVSGSFNENMTVFAEGDVIVTGNLTRTGAKDPVLGLVANNYVRVSHPAASTPVYSSALARTTNVPVTNVTIDAAILAVNDSFLVDNWRCPSGTPSSTGTLTLLGSVAQKYHGPTSDPGANSGDTKSYQYDQRFKYRSPPGFPVPPRGPWRVARITEQRALPATWP